MGDNPRNDRRQALNLATAVGQVMEATAKGIENGNGKSVDIAAAIASLGTPIHGHLEAAIVVIAMMLDDVNCDATKWRREIPIYVSTVAVARLA